MNTSRVCKRPNKKLKKKNLVHGHGLRVPSIDFVEKKTKEKRRQKRAGIDMCITNEKEVGHPNADTEEIVREAGPLKREGTNLIVSEMTAAKAADVTDAEARLETGGDD